MKNESARESNPIHAQKFSVNAIVQIAVSGLIG